MKFIRMPKNNRFTEYLNVYIISVLISFAILTLMLIVTLGPRAMEHPKEELAMYEYCMSHACMQTRLDGKKTIVKYCNNYHGEKTCRLVDGRKILVNVYLGVKDYEVNAFSYNVLVAYNRLIK